MLYLAFAALLSVAYGACPNACSGHGTCGLSSKCSCQQRWVGNDCSLRECPYGLSWIVNDDNTDVPAGGTLGGYHPYGECSNRGTCDRDTGECQCVDGYEGRGCRRTSCPNACSGHGFCRFNYEINSNYKGYGDDHITQQVKYTKQMWDASKTRQCVCDRGYEGIDCASRICPKGDDPLTECNENPGISKNDIQHIVFLTSGATYGADKFFSLTFTDMYNGEYTTRPIHTNINGATTGSTQITTWATEIEAALEELPNFAIPNCTVTATKVTSPADAYLVAIEFVDPANSGEQDLLVVSDADVDHNNAKMQPRFEKTGGGSSKILVAHKYTSGTVNTATHQEALGDNTLEEHVECSNRGTCDGDSGTCACYEGFTGEACHQQTVFF